jgi:uncharacterized phiE125 gp8 family phage protein
MKVERIVPPVSELLTLEQVRDHLRLDACGSPPEHPDDALLQALIDAATQELDAADGFLGRALCSQTWELYLDDWNERVFLPFPPLQSVLSVHYQPPEGAEATLHPSLYQVVKGAPSELVPAYGQSWPITKEKKDAIRIRFVCGYGTALDVPAPIKQYALMQITSWYEHRSTIGVKVEPAPFVRLMLQSYRVGF